MPKCDKNAFHCTKFFDCKDKSGDAAEVSSEKVNPFPSCYFVLANDYYIGKVSCCDEVCAPLGNIVPGVESCPAGFITNSCRCEIDADGGVLCAGNKPLPDTCYVNNFQPGWYAYCCKL